MQSITPTLASRSDLAPRARQLLAQQLAECGQLLEPLLRGALDDLEQELFRIAEQSSGGQAQHEALEALREVKRTRPGFHAYLMALLEQRFTTVGESDPGTAHTGISSSDLELVDPNEFDETMALGDLSSRTELHASNALFELCHRYAVLIAAAPLEGDALPPGPHILADVLGEAARTLGIESHHRRLLYRLCDRRLFAAAESLYGHLNDHLKEAGILPYLRSYLPRRAPAAASSVEDAPAPDASTLSQPMAPVTDFSPPQAEVAAAPSPDMTTLHGLLDARRHALNPASGGEGTASGHAASLGDLEAALATMQSQPARPAAPHAGERLQTDLLAQLRRTSPGDDAPRLQPEHRDAMDLMSLLFDRLLDETHAEGTAQHLLSALQVPLLRVALSDSEFFTVRSHPARRLLNTVLETANLWLDRSDGSFDTALNQRLQRSVQRVVHDYKGDLGVIEREADDLDAHLKLLTRRAEIAERRQIEAAQGRDRLQAARSTARAAIDKRLAHHKTTPLVRALLEHAWTDALTLTVLRDGENSESYRRRLAAADQLLASPTGRDNARLAADLNHGLTQVGLQASEAEQITRHALEIPPAAQSATPQVSQTELLIRLKARQKPEETTAETVAAPRKLPLTHSERKALDKLKALPFGSWLEFTVNQQGQKIARKLAWYAPVSGRCLLVNARGAAAPERTLEQVARMMARGQANLLPPQDNGMLDRAWTALVAGLRKFSKTPEVAP
ncbi:MAG: DUF1631 family protein [Rhodanobacteraceae bacterium]